MIEKNSMNNGKLVKKNIFVHNFGGYFDELKKAK
jgi:hypothetical protein